MSSAFNDDSYIRGYGSRRFDTFLSFSNDDNHDLPSAIHMPPPYVSAGADDTFSQPVSALETPSTPPIYFGSGAYSPDPKVSSPFSPETNVKPFDQGFAGAPDGLILPPPTEMPYDEGFTLFEWRRQNALELQDKERREKEQVLQIREEANEYKIDLQRRTKINCDTNKANNREKEKLFLANQEKFHAEAVKNYWKAIAGLVPNEMPNIEKRKGKKEEKPAIVVIQGPKPGKQTDLARMRSILLKLKHSPPLHMKLAPPPPAIPTMPDQDAKAAASALQNVAVAVNAEAVAAA